MASRLAIIDYGAGNLRSVVNAVSYLGSEAVLVSNPEDLKGHERLLLPGVGSFRRAMEQIKARDLDIALKEQVLEHGVPVLGICLGMQLLANWSSEDGETAGLGLLDCQVDHFSFDRGKYPELKVPHVGFDTVKPKKGTRLFADLGNDVDFYFTHSYRINYPEDRGAVVSECWHGESFAAAVEQGHIAATQFHPEKSQANGLRLLQNFLERF